MDLSLTTQFIAERMLSCSENRYIVAPVCRGLSWERLSVGLDSEEVRQKSIKLQATELFPNHANLLILTHHGLKEEHAEKHDF